jgi:hypothetical protein
VAGIPHRSTAQFAQDICRCKWGIKSQILKARGEENKRGWVSAPPTRHLLKERLIEPKNTAFELTVIPIRCSLSHSSHDVRCCEAAQQLWAAPKLLNSIQIQIGQGKKVDEPRVSTASRTIPHRCLTVPKTPRPPRCGHVPSSSTQTASFSLPPPPFLPSFSPRQFPLSQLSGHNFR